MLKRLACLLLLILTACASSSDIRPAAPEAQTPSAESTLTPPAPTATVSPSPSPAATLTYEQALHPYTVEGLREHEYQSGEVTVLGMIEETRDFTSYLIEYPSDGLNIRGVMQIPTRGEAPYPVIVMNHGWFSRTVFRSGDGTERAAEFLNIRGYLTLASDYRSWGTSDSGPSLYYSGLAIDVVNLLLAIPSIPQADPNRVGMWGHSMGGAVTMKVLTITGKNAALSGANEESEVEGQVLPSIRAAVLYSTVSADQADVLERWGVGCFGDVIAGEANANCNSADMIPQNLPTEIQVAYLKAADDAETLRKVSPINYLEYVNVPVQIHYGEWDGEEVAGTPPIWSIKLFEELFVLGKPAELFKYSEQRHSFINQAWYDFMETITGFFNQNVKSIE